VEVFFIHSFFLAQSVYELKQRHSYVFNVVEEKALKRLKGKEKKRKEANRSGASLLFVQGNRAGAHQGTKG
jgi:hypothetical protein